MAFGHRPDGRTPPNSGDTVRPLLEHLAAAGTRVRLLLKHPDSAGQAQRSAEDSATVDTHIISKANTLGDRATERPSLEPGVENQRDDQITSGLSSGGEQFESCRVIVMISSRSRAS